MNKTKLLSELHTIIATRLRGAWLVKDESQLSSALRALDLVLRPENQGAGAGHLIGPKKSRTKSRSKPRPIPLGEKINFELLSVFMGTRSLRDVPGILKKNGLITETDFDECRQWRSLDDPEMVVKSHVRKAYFQLLAQMSELNSRLP